LLQHGLHLVPLELGVLPKALGLSDEGVLIHKLPDALLILRGGQERVGRFPVHSCARTPFSVGLLLLHRMTWPTCPPSWSMLVEAHWAGNFLCTVLRETQPCISQEENELISIYIKLIYHFLTKVAAWVSSFRSISLTKSPASQPNHLI
jgi:hypothetical protein